MSMDQVAAMADEETELSESAETEELAAQVELLVEENNRLRKEYARARRTRYRRTAVALAAVGVVAIAGGVLFPDSRTVLFALGGTGVFAGLLTYYLTPERFVAASIGEGVYTAFADTTSSLVNELGLQETRVYVPSEAGSGTGSPVRLFVPQHAECQLPKNSDMNSVFVVTETEVTRGVSLYPTGGSLFREFEQALSTELGTSPETLAEQLTDGLLEQFELVEGTAIDIDRENNQLVIGVTGSVYGQVDQFDHPVASFLGVGVAVGFNQPVTVETTSADGDRADYLVTCSWPAPDSQSGFEFQSTTSPSP